MKKFYSFLLLATTLLLSINVMAEDVCQIGTQKYETLKAAFDAVQDGETIQMLTNYTFPSLTVTETYKSGKLNSYTANATNAITDGNWIDIFDKDITLDLNGKTISSDNPFMFRFIKGKFHIAGTGSIVNNSTDVKSDTQGGVTIYKSSMGYPVWMAGSYDPTADHYTHLIVDEDVTLLGHEVGIYTYDIHYVPANYSFPYTRLNGQPCSVPTSALGASNSVKVYNSTDGKYYSKSFTNSAKLLYDLCGYSTAYTYTNSKGNVTQEAGYSYGIYAEIHGTVYGDVYGMNVSGIIKSTTGNIPEYVIYPTANISSQANQPYSVGIYSAGYAKWTIKGTVEAATGVYMKGGEVLVENATISSTATDHQAITEGRGAGVSGSGSAIVIESNASYAESMSITINGGTITGTAGYAIEEIKTTADEKVENFVIMAGTINGGDAGGITMTGDLQEDVIVNGTITGGVYNKDDIQNYIANVDGMITYADGGEDKFQIVPLPVGETIKTDPATAADDSYVKMSGTTSFTVANGETRTFASLMLTSDDNVVTVEDGGKLVVTNAATILGNAKIVVEAGGTFIIEGEQGLIADNVNQLTIEAQEGKMGLFMINPDVSANTTPAATVELVTKAYKNGSNYVWQRIGVPAVNGITASSIVKSVASYLQYWDDQQGKYVGISGPSHLLLPFQGLSLTNDATAPGQKYKFPCNLVGNTNGGLNLVGRWTSFANSYTANIDLQALLHDMKNAANVSAAAYVYRMADDDWDEISYADLVDGIANQTVLEPMQAFIFNLVGENITNAATEINYRNSIWDPVFAPTPAPARRGINSNVTRAIITITDINGNTDKVALRQGVDFSADFDNGYDMTKNMSLSDTRIYANTQLGEMAQVATNDLIGLNLSVASKNETMFKMTFSHINGEELAIRDNLTGSVIDITEGAEYFFSVAENSVNNRFEIIAAHKAPTALDEVGAAHGAKGVYTVLGQYIGSTADINALPAGIYVVDGVKIVK